MLPTVAAHFPEIPSPTMPFSLHLAPNAPWPWLLLLAVALAALAIWAYRFDTPPLPALARRALPALRVAAFAALVLLLAQPVLERARPSSATRVTVLVDRSASMELPVSAGGATRASAADRVAREVAAALRGRSRVEVREFAATLRADSAGAEGRSATALGDALAALSAAPAELRPDGVVVVSDGAVNAGEDPVAIARGMGVPVHAVVVGEAGGRDRAVAEVEAPPSARVGEPATVRVHVRSAEERGAPIGVRVLEDGRERARATVIAPGPGADAVAELSVTPTRPGLAVWTARLDSLAADASPDNDARSVAVEVAPGRLGVLVVSGGLQWDLTFFRRALLGDSTLKLDTRVRERGTWRALESRAAGAPRGADLRGVAVVVLDGIAAAEAGAEFESALAAFVRGGGGLLLFGGATPAGLSRYARGPLASELRIDAHGPAPGEIAPEPQPLAAEALAWDDDPARGAQAWRAAAPLRDVLALDTGGGDRVLVAGVRGGLPLVFTRRAGRGPVLMVNGTGTWRWSLSGTDDLQSERARLLWRRLVHWLSEPVQGEPLRVRPDRWVAPGGEPVRLLATLQDDAFRPVAGAEVRGEAVSTSGERRDLDFAPRESGAYAVSLDGLPPGRWRVSASASRGGREVARATSEFAVDRWSLEALRSEPDSATLGAMAAASGGRTTTAASAGAWARRLEARALTRASAVPSRLWESPWLFALIVGALAAEWVWRRRRGLP